MSQILIYGLVGNSLFASVNSFGNVGETTSLNKIHTEIGGKGFNQALMVNTLGADVLFISAIGNDENKEKVIKDTNDLKLNTKYIIKNGATAEALILTDDLAQNHVYVKRGVELSIDDIDIIDIKNSSLILLQLEIPFDVLQFIIKKAKEYNKPIVLNPAPATLDILPLLKDITYITPNEIEAKILFGDDYLTYMCNHNINGVVTLGDKGCIVVENGVLKTIPPIKVEATDSTGAGDAFNGALVYSLIKGDNLAKAASFANQVAANTVKYHYVIEGIKASC